MPKTMAGASKSAAAMHGGRMYCPYNDRECRCGEFCITSIWSTPRNAVSHARLLQRVVDNCTTRKKMAEREEE
jgi:hypothetical protein